jgi:AcrR family transcriptional regulator
MQKDAGIPKERIMKKTVASSDKVQKKIKKICKAAARVFYKIGYLEANLDDIAAAVKMSKGGIYHYFDSKDEILFCVLDQYMDLVLENLGSQLESLPAGEPKIEFIIKRHLELYASHKEESKTLLHDSNCLSAKYQQRIALKEREYLKYVVDAISECNWGNKALKREEVTALAFLLFGMCNWCYNWYDPKGPIDVNTLSRMILTVFMKGISGYPGGCAT